MNNFQPADESAVAIREAQHAVEVSLSFQHDLMAKLLGKRGELVRAGGGAPLKELDGAYRFARLGQRHLEEQARNLAARLKLAQSGPVKVQTGGTGVSQSP